MMVFGSKAFERCLGYEIGTVVNRIGVLPTDPKDSFAHPPLLWLRFVIRVSYTNRKLFHLNDIFNFFAPSMRSYSEKMTIFEPTNIPSLDKISAA